MGHHGLPEWSKILQNTPAYKFFGNWTTGPLVRPEANYYDLLHRALNGASRELVRRYLIQVGKTSINQLTKEEAKQLARLILTSDDPAIVNFLARLERLNPGSVGKLSSGIDTIDLGAIFAVALNFSQLLDNVKRCGATSCSAGPVF